MASIVKSLSDKKLITPAAFVHNTHYEVIMGSFAYGCSSDMSDVDIYAFCVPPKSIVFPHSQGYIYGFGSKPQNFEQYQHHHIEDPSNKETTYDVTVYNIIKYFDLCMDNNPNMIDSLFVPVRCIIHESNLGNHVRTNRKLFLSKHAMHKFIGYSYNQLNKLKNKTYEHSKRKEVIEKYGFDVKHAYHVRRLIGEAEQILLYGDIDLEADKDALKAIRRGDVPLDDIVEYFQTKEKYLHELYRTSTAVPHKPNEAAIKQILVDCLEMEYGSIDNMIRKDDSVYGQAISGIKKLFTDLGI